MLRAGGYTGDVHVIPHSPRDAHEAAIEAAAGGSGPLFVLYVGSVVPATGKSWCGDCVRAKPAIVQALNAIEASVVCVLCSGAGCPWADTANYSVVCVCACVCVCVWKRVCCVVYVVRARAHVYVYVYVCVCERERERERANQPSAASLLS